MRVRLPVQNKKSAPTFETNECHPRYHSNCIFLCHSPDSDKSCACHAAPAGDHYSAEAFPSPTQKGYAPLSPVRFPPPRTLCGGFVTGARLRHSLWIFA